MTRIRFIVHVPSEMATFMGHLMRGFVSAISAHHEEDDGKMIDDEFWYCMAISNTPTKLEEQAKAYVSNIQLSTHIESDRPLLDDDLDFLTQRLLQTFSLKNF